MAERQQATRYVQSAADVIAAHGLAGATIERIAQQAGVSRVTLHRRGITRAELIAAVVDRAATEVREALWPEITAPGTARERLEGALHALCGVIDRHLVLLAGLFNLADTIFHDKAAAERVTRFEFTEPFERLFRDGAIDGSLQVADPKRSAETIFNVVTWSYVHLRYAHGLRPQRARDQIIQLVLDGVNVRSE